MSIQLNTSGGRSSDLRQEVSAIDEFMNLDNLGGFSKDLVYSINELYRKHQLTLWRLCWQNPPPEAWAEYQQPDSLYQTGCPEVGTDEWRAAANPTIREIAEEKEKIGRHVELYFNEQEHTDPDLIAEVDARWRDEALNNLFGEYELYGFALSALRKTYKDRGEVTPKATQLLLQFRMSHLTPALDAKDISATRKALKDFESLKLRLLKEGSLSRDDYEYMEIANYRVVYELESKKYLEDLERQLKLGFASN